MLDYTVLKVLWWMILGGILVVYATTAGFDVGVTTLMSFFRNENHRRVILNTSAPTWDGNLTWIVFAGGGLFVVWPLVYSTAFSGMYAAMLLILFPLFLRAPGYEYRNKIPSEKWRKFWDKALFVSGVVPVFIFGVATGNCFVGFPFHFDPLTLRVFYTGNFFGLLNPLGILAGLVSVTMVLLHGATFLQRRTEGYIREKARVSVFVAGVVLLALFSVAGLLIIFHTSGYQLISQAAEPSLDILANVVKHGPGLWFDSYFHYPWKFFGPALAYGGILVALWASYYRWYNCAFWSSATAVAGIIGTSGFTLFPFLMPSSTHPDQSITVWNAVSSQYALNIMFYVGCVLLVIIFAYKVFAYHAVWGQKSTLTEDDIRKDEHTYY